LFAIKEFVVKRLFALLIVFGLGGCDSLSVNKPAFKAEGSYSTMENTPAGYSKDGGEIVNGYVLPPYSDPALNDSTLLGIDSNNNGVRDDVERWLIFKYKDHHRIVTEIGFQGARADQFMLDNPNRAEEARQKINGAQSCNFYFMRWAKYNNEPILIDHDILTSTAYKAMQFNTKERIKAYYAHDKKLGGGVYSLPRLSKDYRALCSFDIDALLK
jgi:hypothetical protein